MRYLLDTNVLSELRKRPADQDSRVRSWAQEAPLSDSYISVVSILEIEQGIARLARRDALQAAPLRRWLEGDLIEGFERRILPVDIAVARAAARLHIPDPRPERDALLAATAYVHGLTVATRNVRDFAALEVGLVNPWE